MNRHEWQELETPFVTMKCKHCGQLIESENAEEWNLKIFANCPESLN
ncbi:hypothetical protein [Ammoniphilus sp. YIM 78166]|nr:hypothetical protein [Ammoniphilus sp. YIM 78166]